MLTKVFENRIQVREKANDWKEAVAVVIRPLIDQGYVKETYLDAIYENVEKMGDYFIIMPGFALPHSRPEDGALKTGLSFLKLNDAVPFSSGEEVKILVGLVAADADSHMELLSELTDFLIDEEKMELIYAANTVEQIKGIMA